MEYVRAEPAPPEEPTTQLAEETREVLQVDAPSAVTDSSARAAAIWPQSDSAGAKSSPLQPQTPKAKASSTTPRSKTRASVISPSPTANRAKAKAKTKAQAARSMPAAAAPSKLRRGVSR